MLDQMDLDITEHFIQQQENTHSQEHMEHSLG